MNKIFIITFSTLLGLILIFCGGFVGFFYKDQLQSQSEVCNTSSFSGKCEDISKVLSSEVVQSIFIIGNVSSVGEDRVVVAKGDSLLNVFITDKTTIYYQTPDYRKEAMKLSDLNKGDSLTIVANFSTDAKMMATAITIISKVKK